MFCQITNESAFSVRVRTGSEERILSPGERDIFGCEEKLEVSLSYMAESFSKKIEADWLGERLLVRLMSMFSKKLRRRYCLMVDSDHTFTDVHDSERFSICSLDGEDGIFEHLRSLTILRADGRSADKKRFYPREGDKTVKEYKKAYRNVFLKTLVIGLLISGGIEAVIFALLFALLGVWQELNNAEQTAWIIFGIVIIVAPVVFETVEFIRDVKGNELSKFCKEHSTR